MTGGELKISIRSEDKAINVCYILIRPVNVKAASVVGCKGDVNIDGAVTVADVVLVQKYLLGVKQISGEQAYATDVLSDANLNVLDLGMMKRLLTALD